MKYLRAYCMFALAFSFLLIAPTGAAAQIITAVTKPTANSGPYKLGDKIEVEGVLSSSSNVNVESVKIELLDQGGNPVDTDLNGTIKKDPITDNYYVATGEVTVTNAPFGTGTVNYTMRITFYSDPNRMIQLGPKAEEPVKIQRTPYP